MALLPIIAGSLAADYCWPASPQTYLNDIAAISGVQLDVTGAKYVISHTTTPAATERNFIWHNPNTGHVLTWNSSTTRWEQPHRLPAYSPEWAFWADTPTALLSHDGGDGGANPMWEIVTAFAGRVPVAPGALPGSGTVVAVNATGGSDQATIAAANLPAVKIAVNTAIVGQAGVGSDVPVVGSTYGSTSLAGSGLSVDGTQNPVSGRYYSKGETDNLGTGTALASISPYYSIYIIRRSGRLAYWNA